MANHKSTKGDKKQSPLWLTVLVSCFTLVNLALSIANFYQLNIASGDIDLQLGERMVFNSYGTDSKFILDIVVANTGSKPRYIYDMQVHLIDTKANQEYIFVLDTEIGEFQYDARAFEYGPPPATIIIERRGDYVQRLSFYCEDFSHFEADVNYEIFIDARTDRHTEYNYDYRSAERTFYITKEQIGKLNEDGFGTLTLGGVSS